MTVVTPIFYVGERPTTPLIVTVRNDDGTVKDLSAYSSVQFVGDALPAGTASILNAAQGKVQYDFSAAFTTAVSLTVQVKMISGSSSDYSSPVTLSVQDPTEVDISLVTTAAIAEGVTGVSVTRSNVQRAQGLISLVVGRDISDPLWFASICLADQFWLKSAIAWESADLQQKVDAGTFQMPYVRGAASISNGDISVSYSNTGESASNIISANATMALRRLTWMQTMKSVQAKPFLGRQLVPDPWVLMYRTSM